MQHAHQKGIVHRDLKPSNVLVAEVDGQPRAKVIDFGLAKALHGRLTDATVLTHFGVLLGTPAYMSPEQVQPSPLDVDTRTDVYSLGVLLYELLTGALPFDPVGVREEAIAELRHLLLEIEPTRPSQRLQVLGGDAVELAQHRNTDVGSLQRLLRDDLDWIVLRALERDRSRRYQSASELAADIDRHLRHEPVSAGPPSALYRIRKLARRHRTAAVACAATAFALLSGAIVSGVLYCGPSRRARKPTATAESPSGAATSPRSPPPTPACGSARSRRPEGTSSCARRTRAAGSGGTWRCGPTPASSVRTSRVGESKPSQRRPLARLACVVVPPVYDEQHCASLWLFDPGRDTWRRAALQESVLAVSPDGARAVTTPWWFGGELGSNAPPTAPVPASERGLIRLVDQTVWRRRPRFCFVARAGGLGPPTRVDRKPYYLLMDPVMVMNDLGGDPIRTLEGRYPETVSAIISPDGSRLAAWSWDNTIQIWDLANGRVAGRLAGHRDGIIEVAIAAGGGRVASSSWDRTLRVWDLASAGASATIATDLLVSSVVFSPDGRRLAWGDSAGRVFVAEAANPAAAESNAAHRGADPVAHLQPRRHAPGVGRHGGCGLAWRTGPLQPLGELAGSAWAGHRPRLLPTMAGSSPPAARSATFACSASVGRRCGPSVLAVTVI